MNLSITLPHEAHICACSFGAADDMHGRLLSAAVVGLATEARKGEAGCQQPRLDRIDMRQLLLSINYIF